jgi:hypothetical protein
MELEDKLNSKQLLLEEQRQFLQITISDGTERPILEQLIGKGGYGEVYQGK